MATVSDDQAAQAAQPQPAAQPTLFDPSNPFLGPDYPAMLTTGRLRTPNGERLCLTVRCGPATVSVTIDQASARQWAAQIDRAANELTGLIIPAGSVQ